jgi:signal transduction histidine kinase
MLATINAMKNTEPAGLPRFLYWLGSLLFWLSCSQPVLMSIYSGELSGPRAYVWIAAFTVFGATLIADIALRIVEERSRAAGIGVVCMLLLSGFATAFLAIGPTKYLTSMIVILAAGRLPRIASKRATWLMVGAIELFLLVNLSTQENVEVMLMVGGASAAALIFVVALAQQELRERAARTALAIANTELRANRELLAENSRAAECLRISRDLHDALGHHLAALSIQLDVASRRAPELAVHDIREAHAITRLLLSDVRDVVGTLRHEAYTDAAALIRALCRNIGDLSIHLEVPEGTLLVDAARAEALVRCVQEVITNTLKHATARNLWIQLSRVAGGMTVRAWDDGRGAERLQPGTGLTGMRERFAQLGGEVAVTANAGSGFALHAFVPTGKTPG